ncbi:MAG: hypothetical protein AVO35_11105 [Candidatus Aegiribacteria sp. MLS_C]|nr:MAG: hypothetical protein AVO35_11105 [Candidatus Aegiribacteria sp. MLS_C]
MDDFEKLGLFYLGRDYDGNSKEVLERPLLLESKDLTTHAVCIGMTGSGKTGLCVGLIEEAAIDGIPSIIIDPKGDMSNLLLTFPGLTAGEFLPWINHEEAGNRGISPEEYAESQAQMWRKGLAEWGQDGSRISRLRESAEFSVYTPGSTAGTPVSILGSLSCPPPQVTGDGDLLAEAVSATVTSMLSLLDIEADPLQSREHILLSNILRNSWEKGQDLELGSLIGLVQNPPIKRMGVMDVDSFYPRKDRSQLSLKLNSLLAAPGFQAWLEGEPLNIDRFLYDDAGRPRVSIFHIAHLSDSERMFIVSLLLTSLVNWMRTQQGTTSLRAICYMDEIFGYFPPVAEPPSKKPLLTLLKQARAYGLGMVLTTQNPVDLDYKGLANTGTWFIGRLQTEQDQDRVIDGLKNTAGMTGGGMDSSDLRDVLGGLDKRVFLLNSVHRDYAQVFYTRWAMSYLRGPLTREQVKELSGSGPKSAPEEPAAATATASPQTAPKAQSEAPSAAPDIPVLPSHLQSGFLPVPEDLQEDQGLTYRLGVLGEGTVYYLDSRRGISFEESIGLLCPLDDSNPLPDWSGASRTDISIDLPGGSPAPGAAFAEPPRYLSDGRILKTWERDLKDWVYRNRTLDLLKSSSTGLLSEPGEDERSFRIRLQTAAHEKRDEMMEKLRADYAKKIESLENRVFTAEQRLEKEKEQQKHQKVQTTISLGATLIGALFGGARSSVGRATTSARSASRVMREKQDVDMAEKKLERLKEDLEELNEKLETELEEMKKSFDPASEALETFSVRPLKKNISIRRVMVVWVPGSR